MAVRKLKRWGTRVTAALAACLASSPATAVDPDELSKFDSRFYTIHTNLGVDEVRPYALHMDRVFAEYGRRFSSFKTRDRRQMPLYLLRTRQDYNTLLSKFGINASASGGMFFTRRQVQGLATWVDDENRSHDYMLEVLQHEGFHQFANAYIGGDLPVWVNEGLAEYFGDGLLVGSGMKLGLATDNRVKTVRHMIRENTAIGFDELLDISSQQWHDNMLNGSPRGAMQYDQSWSIVHFLIHGDGGRYRRAFEKYLQLVSQGRLSSKAFRQAFQTEDTTAFRKRWEQYIHDLKPDPLSTAVGRLRFLARGLKYLKANNQPAPANLDALRQALQRHGFRLTSTSHGIETVKSASDESFYYFIRDNGSESRFEMLEPEAAGLLPRITAPGLRPQPTLVWHSDHSGGLESDIQYK